MSKKNPTNYGGLILRGEIWHIRCTVKGIKIAESTHTSNRRQAEQILAKKKAALIEEVVLGGKRPIKVHAAIDLFVASRKHLSSHQSCEIHLRYFKQLPNHNLDRITDTEIESVIAHLREQGYASSTIKVSCTYFNSMLRYCDDKGYTVRKKLKTIKTKGGKVRWLTKDELAKLYAAVDPNLSKDPVTKAQKQENCDLVRLLYETGGRLTEITSMHWNQVDFDAGTVFMKRLKGSISGTIGMTAVMRDILTRRRQLETGEFVFSTKVGKNNNSPWMRAAVKRAALSNAEGSVTLHTLRHTRAVHLLQAGLGLLELKEFLGHRDIQSTLVYSHVVKADVMNKVVRLTDAVTQE